MQAEIAVQMLRQAAQLNKPPAEIAAFAKQLGGILSQLVDLHRLKFSGWTSADQLSKVG
jgi:hypothetical protein